MSDRDKTDPGTVVQRPEFISQVVVDAAGLSHVGRVRTNNEDHFLISRMGRFMEVEHTNIPKEMQPERFEECFYGMIVADGVGGGAAGEVASRTAIRSLVDMAATSPNWIFRLDDDQLVNDLRARLRTRAGQIHDELIRTAKSDPSLKGFGTTMTIALSVGNVLFLSHIGDSRAYLFRQGVLQQLTHDHTLAQELTDKGFTSQDGVPVERFRHVLTQALTDRAGAVEPEVITIDLEDKDRVLLCTDGLTDMVEDSAIADVLAEPVSSADVCRMLVERALESGGTDNVTVALTSYRIGDSDTQY
ncbi:MAG TPA: protein phosphatase 2C domain-containing protein [Candidatus Eisenbacteria bacterium]|nr:protein phosphatase 2C domain-containing protein [Candidatus Eisenbacteria bacterium]